MAVEATGTSDRQVVSVTWDKSILDGELVQMYCVNPDNGDVSNSGLSANDGTGQVSYPAGYSGSTEVTVYDNHGNADFGVITVGEDGEIVPPDPGEPPVPTHPIVLPPDSPLEPTHPIVLPPEGETDPPVPTHPIVLPPLGIWPNPPEGSVLPDHELPGDQPRPDHELPEIPGLPSHPIVFPPEVTPHRR